MDPLLADVVRRAHLVWDGSDDPDIRDLALLVEVLAMSRGRDPPHIPRAPGRFRGVFAHLRAAVKRALVEK